MTSPVDVDAVESGAAAPENWVPVERRFLGLDKRTILPAILILLLVAVYSSVLPAINDAVSFD